MVNDGTPQYYLVTQGNYVDSFQDGDGDYKLLSTYMINAGYVGYARWQ